MLPLGSRSRNGVLAFLQAAEGLELLLAGLEAAVPNLGGRVDELELDVLQCSAGRLHVQRLPQGDQALLCPRHCPL